MYKFFRLFLKLWNTHQIFSRAASLTYTFILGLVPALAVCLSVLSVVFDVRKVTVDFKVFLLKFLAAGAGDTALKYIDNSLSHVRFKTIGVVGFAIVLITSLLLLSSLEDAINRIWSIRKNKALWKRIVIYNLILLFGPVCVSLSVASSTIVSNFFPHLLIKANVGAVLISGVFISLTYKIFPNKKVDWSAAFFSGFLVAIICELAKWGYAAYTAKSIFYNKVYGGLAALPLFLVWIYVNWTIFLGGALLCFMIQHRKTFRVKGIEQKP